MPTPTGCTFSPGAFSAGFNNGFQAVTLVCGPFQIGAMGTHRAGRAEGFKMTIQTQQIIEGQTVVLLTRLEDLSGNPIDPEAVESIRADIIDLESMESQGVPTLTVGDVLYDELQTGNGWLHDVGWNCRIVIPGTSFPDGSTTYRVQLHIKPVGSEEECYALWNLPTTEVYDA